MKKSDAVSLFCEQNRRIVRRNFIMRDKPAVRQAWNDFVDNLKRNDMITAYQAHVWVNPFLSKKDR